jgi:hypothetical protein
MTQNIVAIAAALVVIANAAARVPPAAAKFVKSITPLVRATAQLRAEVRRAMPTRRQRLDRK